jgi:hypothetical protein
MEKKRSRLGCAALATIALLALVAGCTALPEAPVAPPVVETAAPAATPAEVASPAPTTPDPRSDPLGALLYSAAPGRLESAEFSYEMRMGISPVDDAAREALGPAALMLSAATVKGSGEGAISLADTESGRADVRLDMTVSVLGQEMRMGTILVGGTMWTRLGDGPWEKQTPAAMGATVPGGLFPDRMLESLNEAQELVYVGEELLDGRQVHHLRYTVAPAALDAAGLLKGLEVTGGFFSAEDIEALLGSTEVVADVYLATEDLSIARQAISMEMVMAAPPRLNAADARLRLGVDMVMGFDKLNEPVTILPPDMP